MELKSLKTRLGNWLTIEELKHFLSNLPDEIANKIPINRELLEHASEFVEERKGWWEHHDWESFLARLEERGFSLSEEVKAPIGNILEIFKGYYHSDNFHKILEKRRSESSMHKASSASRKRTCRRASRAMKEA